MAKTKSISPDLPTPSLPIWSESLRALGSPLRRLRAEQCRRSLRKFLEAAWPVVEPAVLVPGWHIDAICEHVEAVTRGQIKNLLITVPPRHGKSTIVSVMWPCWEWIEHPERRWLLAGYAEKPGHPRQRQSRRLISSNWYQLNWGGNYELSEDVNNRHRMETSHGGHRIALGTGGSATGEGGDRLILDDPHNLAVTWCAGACWTGTTRSGAGQ